jgi:two-component system, chemotaxis family, chemotaxis protein CheY
MGLCCGVSMSLTFLVCDDSPLIRVFVRRSFEGAFEDVQVLEASDGKEALSLMRSNRVHLIITDLQMEGMDGDSFLRLLKRNPVLASKPVLVLSGMISGELRQEFEGRNDVSFLPKPASSSHLVEAAQKMLAAAVR